MSNCLFEAAYERIIHDCNCMPSFHQLAHKDVSEICTGPGLTCMNKILRFIGKLNRVSVRAGEIPKFFEYRPSNLLNGCLGQDQCKEN